MGRPRKPTNVLEMRGAFVKHPERRKARAHEPEVTRGLGDPPQTLNESEQARWRELGDWCTWLTIVDRPIVEQTCRLWQLERDRKATPADSKMLAANLSHLGMTPVDRSKVQQRVDTPKSKLEKYAS